LPAPEPASNETAATEQGPKPIDRLIRRLQLEPSGPNDDGSLSFRGEGGQGAATEGDRLFGGLVLAQSIMAAGAVLTGRAIHVSQHSFLRSAQANVELDYRVRTTMSGRTFASVIVEVVQRDVIVCHAQISATAPDVGPAHEDPMVRTSAPDDAVNRDKLRGRANWRDQPFDMRLLPEEFSGRDPSWTLWSRAVGDAIADPLTNVALLAYASDRSMLSTAWKPHASTGELRGVTLNHTIWFHQPVEVHRWHQHALHSSWAANGRGLIHGRFHRDDGLFVASTAQEAVVRVRR